MSDEVVTDENIKHLVDALIEMRKLRLHNEKLSALVRTMRSPKRKRDKLTAEVARLREALKSVVKYWDAGNNLSLGISKARAALKEVE